MCGTNKISSTIAKTLRKTHFKKLKHYYTAFSCNECNIYLFSKDKNGKTYMGTKIIIVHSGVQDWE